MKKESLWYPSAFFTKDKTNNLLTLVKVGSTKYFKLLFWVWLVIYDLYLFHITVLLNPDINFSKSFLPFYFDKVTTGTYNFVSVVWNSNLVGGLFVAAISAKTQFFHQFKISSIPQLINGIFKVLQKLLKYFSGIKTSVLFLPTMFAW